MNFFNSSVKVTVMTIMVWICLTMCGSLGAPGPRQDTQLYKIWREKIDCAKYMTLMTDSKSSAQALTVTSRGKRLALRNATVHPITLQNLFVEEQVSLFTNRDLKQYKTFSDEYLSITDHGHLITATTGQATVSLRYDIPNTNTTSSLLCAIGGSEQNSYLVSPFKSVRPISLNSTVCDNVDNFKNAVSNKDVLTEVLTKAEYHFQLSSVINPTGDYVSKDLKSLCCSFDEKCKLVRYIWWS